MTNFIKEQQEEARNKMAQQPQRDIDGFAYIRTDNITDELDPIISQVVQNTVTKVLDVITVPINPSNDDQREWYRGLGREEQAVEDRHKVQSLLKDITTGV